jgi:hypothetical protein
MAAITTKVVLIITLFLPERPPLMFSAPMDNLAECWVEAQELTERAEEGPLRTAGGSFSAACSVRAQPSQEH